LKLVVVPVVPRRVSDRFGVRVVWGRKTSLLPD
jgi:hypothetical protein